MCHRIDPSKGNVLKLAIKSRLFASASKARLSTGATILAYGRLFSPVKPKSSPASVHRVVIPY